MRRGLQLARHSKGGPLTQWRHPHLSPALSAPDGAEREHARRRSGPSQDDKAPATPVWKLCAQSQTFVAASTAAPSRSTIVSMSAAVTM